MLVDLSPPQTKLKFSIKSSKSNLVFKSHPSFNNVGFATHGVVVGSTNQRFPTVASFGAQVRRSKAQSSVLRRVQSHGDSVAAILMWDSDDHSTKAGLVFRHPGRAGRIF